MVQTIDKEIIDYIHLLNLEQKQSILSMLKSFTTAKQKRISIAQYNKEIDEAVEQARNGNFITQKEMEEISKTW